VLFAHRIKPDVPRKLRALYLRNLRKPEVFWLFGVGACGRYYICGQRSARCRECDQAMLKK
jgi:hypothetical protein